MRELSGWKRIKDLDEIRHLADSASKKIDVKIEIVEFMDDETIDSLMWLDETFPELIRYEPEEYIEASKREDSTLLVVHANAEPVSFNLAYSNRNLYGPVEYFIDEIVVRKDMQNLGIGSSLLRLGFVIASRLGYTVEVLECSGENDEGMATPKYYQKHGFDIYCEGCDDSFKMIKKLTPKAVQSAIELLQH